MGLPSGVLWAPCNIDVSRQGGFAKSPFTYNCSFFSWGNVDGHNPTGPASFSPWTFGSTVDGEPYVSSEGAQIDYPGSIELSNDPARIHCGGNWHMPSNSDMAELIENVDFIDANGDVIDTSVVNKIVTINGINGIMMRSRINGNKLFFAAAGYGNGLSLTSQGGRGHYWLNLLGSAERAKSLLFYSSGVYPNYDGQRYLGYAIRPVMTSV